MAVNDDMLVKTPFGFQLAGGIYNDEKARIEIKIDEFVNFLKMN